jgi:hypothetical protein
MRQELAMCRFAHLGLVLVAVCLLASGSVVTGCGGDSTGPEVFTCEDVAFNYSGSGGTPEITFNFGCDGGTSSGVSNITYDQFSRVTAYDYEFMCQDGSRRQVGRVSNIHYNSIGQPLSLEFTHNGKSCDRVIFTY